MKCVEEKDRLVHLRAGVQERDAREGSEREALDSSSPALREEGIAQTVFHQEEYITHWRKQDFDGVF